MTTGISSSSTKIAATTTPTSSIEWIHLTEGKQFSRLLYTNPVCFLCTHPLVDNDQQGTDIRREDEEDGHSHEEKNKRDPSNVMVLSWLTATNNHGNFMMSLNKGRHTAKFMSHANRNFCLCVPTRGMEDLVLAVGGMTGAHGSKFPSTDRAMLLDSDNSCSKRQMKKQRRTHGIQGLIKVPMGGGAHPHEEGDVDDSSLFAIHGTIAHLYCRTESILDHTIDDEHVLILARVFDAYCHIQYWDPIKSLFRPKPGVLPYLSFFGSQTFGYVVSKELLLRSEDQQCHEEDHM